MTGGILALDVATTTGWAYGCAGGQPAFGHWRAGPRGVASGEALAAFRAWLDGNCTELAPGWLVFEAPYVPRVAPPRIRTRSGHTVRTLPAAGPPIDIYVLRRLIGLCGLVEMIAAERGIPCREAAPTEICRVFTGRGSWGGRAQKKAATQKMAALYGWAGATEDEADALALWVYAEAVLFPKAARERGCGPLFARPAAAAGAR